MVKKLSPEDKKMVANSITEAERITSAEIILIVSEISDAYQYYTLLIALTFGSLFTGVLWLENIVTYFPYLLMTQIMSIGSLYLILSINKSCTRFIPRKILHHRTAHRAYEEYVNISYKIPASVPVLVFYISVAEHYAHIITSRDIREKTSNEIWNSIIDEFTKNVVQKGLRDACTDSIRHIARQLASHFPAKNTANYISNEVITT